ncbi:MAG TPA: hypothetical protein VFP59_03800 [Candidatus Angelobacter sp.]|nr:hypothetical protein [Candidatus Angelobacter sp.]
MKETAQSKARPQKASSAAPSSSHSPGPLPETNRMAQLAAMVNASPQMQPLFQLKGHLQHSQRAQQLTGLANAANGGVVQQEQKGDHNPPAQKAQNADSVSAVIQRTEIADHGAVATKKYYAAQIEATGTDRILEAVALSQATRTSGAKQHESGVFLSDDLIESHHWLVVGEGQDVSRVVVPDKDYFEKNPNAVPEPLKSNGLTPAQNCNLVAEHELIHARQAHQNIKGGAAGAQTGAKSFTTDFEATMLELNDLARYIDFDDSSSVQLSRLAGPAKYIKQRLAYIESTKKSRDSNAEAPTVMRELRRYLEVSDLKGTSRRFTTFYNKIKELDEECKESLGLPRESGSSCFLTTACVSARRLPDSCEELTVLRAFRDGYMRSLPDGPGMIRQYYETAPALVQAIDCRPDKKDIYDEIYAVIRSCVEAIHNNEPALALNNYRSMVVGISEKAKPLSNRSSWRNSGTGGNASGIIPVRCARPLPRAAPGDSRGLSIPGSRPAAGARA